MVTTGKAKYTMISHVTGSVITVCDVEITRVIDSDILPVKFKILERGYRRLGEMSDISSRFKNTN